MTSPYAWVLDRDHLYEQDPPDPDTGPTVLSNVGTVGPGDANVQFPDDDADLYTEEQWRDVVKESLARNYQHHHQFRMYDDDGILYVTGTLYWNGSPTNPDFDAENHWQGEICYSPLREYGEGALGAVEIRYTDRKEWDCG